MAKVTEVVKEIAQCWQKLKKEDRSIYKEAAKKGNQKSPAQIILILFYRQGKI
jgi:hypothetical protein